MLLPIAVVILLSCSAASSSRFVAIGDWGIDNKDQYDTAKTLSRWCHKHICSFIVSMGDNFYPAGVNGLDDPRFDSTWKDVYNLPGINDLNWYLVLGNHDHLGCPMCQVEFSHKEARWNLPSLWYDKRFVMDQMSIHLVFIDTYTMVQKLSGHQDQLLWLRGVLKKSDATWKVVIGHHPPYTAGRHFPGEVNIANDVIPILEEYGVDVFLLGHDHNFQRIRRTSTNSDSLDYVIAGAGGKEKHPYTEGAKEYLKDEGYDINYFLKANGFVDIEVEEAQLIVRYVTTKSGRVVYQFERSKRNHSEL